MPKFSKKSLERLNTCHKDIQKIMNEVIKIYDISILEGIRSKERQIELYNTGRSKLDGVNKKSKHQGKEDEDGNIVSFAIDIMPYAKGENPFSGKEKDNRRFYFMAGIVKACTLELLKKGEIKHDIRWGGDWDSDFVYNDQNFDDLPHIELVNKSIKYNSIL